MPKLYTFSSLELAKCTLYIFGASSFGILLHKLLSSYNLEIKAFIDNDPTKQGSQICGKRVITADRLRPLSNQLIIVASRYYVDICQQLSELGFSENRDFIDAVFFAIEEQYKLLAAAMGQFKNKHNGERVFLIGNGPSLSIDDLNRLKNETTFAANRIYLSYSETAWRPSYYCACDPLVTLYNREIIDRLPNSKFIANSSCFYGSTSSNTFVLPYTFRFSDKTTRQVGFSFDPLAGLFDGGSVIYMMLQIAVFMGFKQIYFLGLDHAFEIDEQDESELLISKGEKNHFHQNYRQAGESWSRPDLNFIQDSFEHAKLLLEPLGITLVNLSRRTRLDTFAKDDIENIV